MRTFSRSCSPKRADKLRFIDTNKHTIHARTYLPFGIGPRNCIGSRFVPKKTKPPFTLERCTKGRRSRRACFRIKPRTAFVSGCIQKEWVQKLNATVSCFHCVVVSIIKEKIIKNFKINVFDADVSVAPDGRCRPPPHFPGRWKLMSVRYRCWRY